MSNSSIDVLRSMGITCSRKTVRGIIKLAGNRCDEMALVILEYQKNAVCLGSLVVQLDKLMNALYLYFGRNRFVTICLWHAET